MSEKKTTDLYFAAALLSLGAKLESVDREDVHHMEFRFSLTNTMIGITKPMVGGNGMEPVVFGTVPGALADLDEYESQWANKTLMVNAQEYADAIKRMKSLVHTY